MKSERHVAASDGAYSVDVVYTPEKKLPDADLDHIEEFGQRRLKEMKKYYLGGRSSSATTDALSFRRVNQSFVLSVSYENFHGEEPEPRYYAARVEYKNRPHNHSQKDFERLAEQDADRIITQVGAVLSSLESGPTRETP